MRGLPVWDDKRRGISFASVLLNAGTLVGSNVISAGLGAIYWGIAARSFDPSEVGMASAALAATLLVGSLSALGTTTLLVGELPRRTTIERSRLVMTAMLVTGTAGAILGVAFAVTAPLLSPELRSFVGEWASATIIIVRSVWSMMRRVRSWVTSRICGFCGATSWSFDAIARALSN